MNIREAYAEFMAQFGWDWFVTLTFKHKVTVPIAEMLFKRWMSTLGKVVHRRIDWVMAMEWQKIRGVPHFHVLIRGIPHDTDTLRLALMNTWEHTTLPNSWVRHCGFARILSYDKTKGAEYYLTKYVIKELGDITLSKRL